MNDYSQWSAATDLEALCGLSARTLDRELIDVHWGEALGDKALDALAEAHQIHVYPASMHRPVIAEFWTGLARFAEQGGSTR